MHRHTQRLGERGGEGEESVRGERGAEEGLRGSGRGRGERCGEGERGLRGRGERGGEGERGRGERGGEGEGVKVNTKVLVVLVVISAITNNSIKALVWSLTICVP